MLRALKRWLFQKRCHHEWEWTTTRLNRNHGIVVPWIKKCRKCGKVEHIPRKVEKWLDVV